MSWISPTRNPRITFSVIEKNIITFAYFDAYIIYFSNTIIFYGQTVGNLPCICGTYLEIFLTVNILFCPFMCTFILAAEDYRQ